MRFITGKHSAPDVPARRARRSRCPTSTRCAGGGRPLARRSAQPTRRGSSCIELAHGAAGCNTWGASQNLWAPEEIGRNFELNPDGALAPLEPYREYLTIVSNTDVRMAEAFEAPEIGGDHFRSSAVFLTQSHPKQTQGSDVFVGTSLDQIVRAKDSARTRRFRRCSCASRTWIRPAAATTTTRAPTPTRSAGRARPSRCR